MSQALWQMISLITVLLDCTQPVHSVHHSRVELIADHFYRQNLQMNPLVSVTNKVHLHALLKTEGRCSTTKSDPHRNYKYCTKPKTLWTLGPAPLAYIRGLTAFLSQTIQSSTNMACTWPRKQPRFSLSSFSVLKHRSFGPFKYLNTY